MIRIDLQQFAKTASEMRAYRQSLRMAKNQMPGNGQQEEPGQSSAVGNRKTSSGPIKYSREIQERIPLGETYRVERYSYDTDRVTKTYDDMDAEDLRNMLRGYEYDEDQKEWYSERSNSVYRVVKRRR